MDDGTRRPVRRGFSVLELTIAIAILGIMMAVAGFAFIPYLNRAKVSATKTTMRNVGQNLASYYADKGAFPVSLRELVPEYLDSTPLDGWDREFYYNPQGPTPETFILISLGKDGRENTDDDINYLDLRN